MVKHHRPRIGPAPTPPPTSRFIHTAIGAGSSLWKLQSLEAVSEALPPLKGTCSEEGKILFAVISFLATGEKVPKELLIRGSSWRKRWNRYGEIKEAAAIDAGLVSELSHLLSDTVRLNDAFRELLQLSAVSEVSNDIYMIDSGVAARVRERLCSEIIAFWEAQALMVAYRAIPWKYLESA
jgi:hypothetical protein